MNEYKRAYPMFSLCGLNCGLCPRYQSDGASKCTGCGGKDFHTLHPACAVITCNKKHDNVEFCFQCSAYPCDKYHKQSDKDSFITYKNVLTDFKKVKDKGIDKYISQLNEKIKILEFLINNYNDGRKKSFYCTAVNLLELSDLKDIINQINNKISKQDIYIKDKIKLVVSALEDKATQRQIMLELRK